MADDDNITTQITKLKTAINDGSSGGVRLTPEISKKYLDRIDEMISLFGDVPDPTAAHFGSPPGGDYNTAPSALIREYNTVATDFNDRRLKSVTYLNEFKNAVLAAKKRFENVDNS